MTHTIAHTRRHTLAAIMALACLAAAHPTAAAQQLSDTQKEQIHQRVVSKVNEFQNYVNRLADKAVASTTVKENAFRQATNLFIGKCEQYTLKDENGVAETHPAVRMEVSSIRRSTKQRRLIKAYLRGLQQLRYQKVEIRASDAVRVSEIERVGDHYEAAAVFAQVMIGTTDRRVIYSDRTTKKIRVIIEPKQVHFPSGVTKTIWDILLADIYVLSTELLN